MCYNFIHEWRILHFKVVFEQQIFEALFTSILFFFQTFSQKSAQRKSPRKHTTIIITITACLTQHCAIRAITATVLLELYTQLVTILPELQLTVFCSVLSFGSPTRSIKRKFLKWNVLVLGFSITLLQSSVYVNSHICLCLMLYWYKCLIYLLVCICVDIAISLCWVCVIYPSQTHIDVIVGLLINSSVWLLFYYFHMNDMKSFPLRLCMY